jgi:hypothetical protein
VTKGMHKKPLAVKAYSRHSWVFEWYQHYMDGVPCQFSYCCFKSAQDTALCRALWKIYKCTLRSAEAAVACCSHLGRPLYASMTGTAAA